MKTLSSLIAGGMVFSFAILPILACDEGKPLSEVKPLERASGFFGMSIRDAQGTMNGTVLDIELSEDRNHVDQLIVAFEGREGSELVPFKGLHITPDGNTLIYLTGYEGMSGMSEPYAAEQPEELAGLTAAALGEPTADARVSSVLGVAVRDIHNRRVGILRDLLISSESGQITEATVAVRGFLGIGQKLASVEWPGVWLPAGAKYARLDRTVNEVRALAYREGEYWQHLGFGGMAPEEVLNGAGKETKAAADPLEDDFRLYR
jgi:sporulation protein YlmC with PRC-barrel domain